MQNFVHKYLWSFPNHQVRVRAMNFVRCLSARFRSARSGGGRSINAAVRRGARGSGTEFRKLGVIDVRGV